MKVAGFTFVRNSVQYDYPILESILSILDICNSFYVLVGDCNDGTLEQIQSIQSDKIKILHSIWDQSLKAGGQILAVETNKIKDLIDTKYDWLFYLQADEVVHEKYLPTIKNAMIKYKDDKNIEGLLLNYLHFIAAFNYVGYSRRWYRKEIRIIRNDKSIKSYKDAQGFRIHDRKLKVKPINAYVYHYGYVRNPKAMFNKALEFNKYYKTANEYDKFKTNFINQFKDSFDYKSTESVQYFKGTHPEVMAQRIKNYTFEIKIDVNKKNFPNFRYRILFYIEKYFKVRLFEYKNYQII